MREFKFIRGIYKDEKIFNTDETDGTLFALYKNGGSVSLDIKNDETFQKTIADLESDNREIYTIRPSQFNVEATRQSNNTYAFEYDLDGKFVYDNSKKFPDKVKESAAYRLKENTTASIEGDPKLILSGDQKKPTLVSFTFNDRPAFEKDLYFRVSGQVNEYSIGIANDEGLTAYKKTGDNIDFNDKLVNRTFYQGKVQDQVMPKSRDIAPEEKNNVNDTNYDYLDVASRYNTAEGFKFVHNNNLVYTAPYNDPLDFDLYKFFNGQYLVKVDKSEAIANNMLRHGYVAYSADNCPPNNCCLEGASSCVFAYEYLQDDTIDVLPPDLNDCSFYRIDSGEAYIKIGKCVAKDKGNIIVKGYAASYKDLFIIKNNGLQQIENSDINGKTISVYIKDSGKDYHIINSRVYINDSTNDSDYVTLSFTKKDEISSSNAIASGKNVVPKQDGYTFRQIVDGTLNITATES
jgi:hypothetical protein